MKKISKILVLTPFVLLAANGLTACNKSNEFTLRILNSEDYIYLRDKENPEDKDLIDQFKDYVRANYPQYKNINVIYDTSDTNETIYSEIQTGKSMYDLVNVSEYMAQKIVNGGYAHKIDRSKIPNYNDFASGYIVDRLDNISTELDGQEVFLKDYAVGYMWGTLGILFNPEFPAFESSGITPEEVINDMQTYETLWNEKYHGTISVKNSMRDTYAVGVLYTYREQFQEIKDKYQAYLDGVEEYQYYDLEHYQSDYAKLFNSSDEETVKLVEDSLNTLKKNVFGLEVDSGKQDIIKKKIGINLAWSGDATYAMEQAEEVGVELLYSVPELGSNIWSDVWVMPNIDRSDAQYELAHIFLDYLSDPSVASLNMNYTGYTSFVGGDDILELTRDWYDCRTEEMYEGDEIIYSVNEENEEFVELDYPDFLSAHHDDTRNGDYLAYFVPYLPEGAESEDEIVLEPEDYADFIAHCEKVYNEDETVKTYADLTIVDVSEEVTEVDLTYFFDGTLYETAEDKYGEDLQTMIDAGEEPAIYGAEDMVFYAYDYFAAEDNCSVGGAFFTQYPSEETINRCGIMEDYGKNNENILKMWERFKSDPLPNVAIIILIVILSILVAYIVYMVVNKVATDKIRKKRLNQK